MAPFRSRGGIMVVLFIAAVLGGALLRHFGRKRRESARPKSAEVRPGYSPGLYARYPRAGRP